jgi:hypothetical protein
MVRLAVFSVFFTYFMMCTDIGSYICKNIINNIKLKPIQYVFQCPYCMSFHIYFWSSMVLRYEIFDSLLVGLVVAWAARMTVKYGL